MVDTVTMMMGSKMKTKITKSSHQKALDKMNQETKRAIHHVEFLEKLYQEMKKAKT